MTLKKVTVTFGDLNSAKPMHYHDTPMVGFSFFTG